MSDPLSNYINQQAARSEHMKPKTQKTPGVTKPLILGALALIAFIILSIFIISTLTAMGVWWVLTYFTAYIGGFWELLPLGFGLVAGAAGLGAAFQLGSSAIDRRK